jgi:diguanylate cyclase (GGDEF)-like protein
MVDAGPADERDESLKKGRDLVRRTALLLSADLPLQDLLRELADQLGVFVDASIVQVAVSGGDSLLDYVFRDGKGVRPSDSTIRPDGPVARVLRDGESLLYRTVSDWPPSRTITVDECEGHPLASGIFVPIRFGGRTVGVLSVQSQREHAYHEEHIALLETCALYLGARIHDERNAALAHLATTDSLTGLPNRRAFDEALLREWRRCARSGSSLALAMIDVDYFKLFNDAFGHVAGDACLRHVAHLIASCGKRPGDFPARYGGEEFALILPETDVAGAVQVADSVCAAVNVIAIPHEGSSRGHVTLSVGVAALVPDAGDDAETLVSAADSMLYEAKKNGRNRVVAKGHHSAAPAERARVLVRHNLPRYLTETVGQERNLSDVAALLHTSPLVSVVGPGGVGKTRLAVQAAKQVLETYEDGVWFVDLAPLDDASRVPGALAEVFNVADEEGSQPLIERVGLALEGKRLMVVLDNCEHVASAAADAAHQLLRLCPQVQILATSRESPGVEGEAVYRMPSLTVPPEGETMTAERALGFSAVTLFVTRAQSARRAFELTDKNVGTVSDIVRRLDGLALAIELAASRTKTLSLDQLDQRLDERFKLLTGGSRTARPRHQSLRALIGWSYDLLNDAERSFLRQSAIFRGGWTLEAAEAVSIDALPGWNVLDLLSSLVDKSLVVLETEGEEQRYRLLESTRQFALERLIEAGERDDLAARHCHFFAQAAQRLGDEYWQSNPDLWIARGRLDLENLRAAVAWGLAGGDIVAAATIVVSLRWLWYWTGRREGRVLFERASAALPDDAPPRVRGLIAIGFGGQSSTGVADAVRILSGGTDEIGRAEALAVQGRALGQAGRLSESAEMHEQAVAVARATRMPRLIGKILTSAAYWLGAAGARQRAHAFYDEAGSLLRASNDWRQLAVLQVDRAELYFDEGNCERALTCAREVGALNRERGGEGWLLSVALQCVALLNSAAYLLALARFDEAWAYAHEGLEVSLRAEASLRTDDRVYILWAIGHLAHVCAETGDPVRSTRLLGYADAVYRRSGKTREPTERRGYDRALDLIRAALDEERIQTLMAEGAAMDEEEAASIALAISDPGKKWRARPAAS